MSIVAHSFLWEGVSLGYMPVWNWEAVSIHILSFTAATKSRQWCPTLCDPIDGSPPGSLVPGDSPGKNTGVGCHFPLQCMKVKSKSEVVQSCPTLSDPMDCSPPGSSIHGIFQARALEWGATAFSDQFYQIRPNWPHIVVLTAPTLPYHGARASITLHSCKHWVLLDFKLLPTWWIAFHFSLDGEDKHSFLSSLTVCASCSLLCLSPYSFLSPRRKEQSSLDK